MVSLLQLAAALVGILTVAVPAVHLVIDILFHLFGM